MSIEINNKYDAHTSGSTYVDDETVLKKWLKNCMFNIKKYGNPRLECTKPLPRKKYDVI